MDDEIILISRERKQLSLRYEFDKRPMVHIDDFSFRIKNPLSYHDSGHNDSP